MDLDVTKGGEQFISIVLTRTRQGLKTSIKANPKIEEFFSSFAETQGAPASALTISRQWTSETHPKLLYYRVPTEMCQLHGSSPFYRIDTLARPLIFSRQDGGELDVVNLSFIRLVGISDPGGIEFTSSGVLSRESLETVKTLLGGAIRNFYQEWMQEIKKAVIVTTQEI